GPGRQLLRILRRPGLHPGGSAVEPVGGRGRPRALQLGTAPTPVVHQARRPGGVDDRYARPALTTDNTKEFSCVSHRASADQSSSGTTCASISKTPPRGRLATRSMTSTKIGRAFARGPVNEPRPQSTP